MKSAHITDQLSRFQRVPIVHGPTPLLPLRRLSALLGGPEIWIKRDDLTAIAGGGNKARKLEFLLADVGDADTVVTVGAIQSNHARQTAAAAAQIGLRCVLLLTDSVDENTTAYRENGNVLLDTLFGATLHFIGADTNFDRALEDISARLINAGAKPYFIPVGGSSALGTLGYVDCFAELLRQMNQHSLSFDQIYLPTGSAGTHAGMLLGAVLSAWPGTIKGISVNALATEQHAKVTGIIREVADLIEVDPASVGNPTVMVDDTFIGPGYGQPGDDTIEAIKLVARTEGILLDPVYSGKSMSALISDVRNGGFAKNQRILFLHTGGTPAMAAFPSYFGPERP